jgi:hypothetical protein
MYPHPTPNIHLHNIPHQRPNPECQTYRHITIPGQTPSVKPIGALQSEATSGVSNLQTHYNLRSIPECQTYRHITI